LSNKYATLVSFDASFAVIFRVNYYYKVSVPVMSIPSLQAYAAEAGAERAEEPMEEAGMSDEIIQKAGILCIF